MDGTEQRHVHYGQWPTNGIIRKEHGGAPIELDLFAQPKHEETFTLTSNVAKNGTWSYEILDPDIAEVKRPISGLSFPGPFSWSRSVLMPSVVRLTSVFWARTESR